MSPGYKKTEVGVIPVDWDVRSVREICSVVRGASPRPAGDPRFFNGSSLPWLTVASLTNIPEYQLRVSETASRLTRAGVAQSRVLPRDTVIISNSGATLGVAKLLNVTCCANDGIAALIDQGSSDKAFVCYYINLQTRRLRNAVASGNGQPNLNTTLIGSLAIPLPPVPEQRAIAATIEDIDALLAANEQLIAKKRDVKQAAMQRLLTGEQRLPGFVRARQQVTLRQLGEFTKGKGIKRDEITREGVPCIRYGEIYTVYGAHVSDPVSRIARSVARTSQRLRTGDVLFAASGETAEEIGKAVAYVGDGEAYAGGDIVILTPNGQDSRFLGYLLNHSSVAAQRARMGQGDAVVHIGARQLGALELTVPEPDEQRAIAAVLADMDAELAALEQRLTKTRALKQAMMQELLTGRTRLVPPAPEQTA